MNIKYCHKVIHIDKDVSFAIRSDQFMRSDYYVIGEVWKKRVYEQEGLRIGKKDVVIDIGAHLGAFTVYAAKRATLGRVFSFEPSKANFLLLKENVRLNNLHNVSHHRVGVAGKKQKIKLYLDPISTARNSCYLKSKRYELINCLSLKDVFEKHKIKKCDFLKIDCEGAEYDILKKAPRNLYRLISKIVLEYHDCPDWREQIRKIVTLLFRCGFIIKVSVSKRSGQYDCGMLYAYRDNNIAGVGI